MTTLHRDQNEQAEAAPSPTTTNDATTTHRSNGVIGRARKYVTENWKIITATSSVLAAIVMFIGGCTEIPNNVMGWVSNWRELNRKSNEAANSENAFAVVCRTGIFPATKHRDALPPFWFVTLKGERTACPVFFMFYIHVTSNKPNKTKILSYSVETKMGDKWEKLGSYDMERGSLYWANTSSNGIDFTNAFKMEFQGNLLQTQLTGKTISQDETVNGWLCLDIPKRGCGDEFRFVADLTGGERTIQPIAFPSKEPLDIQTEHSATYVRGQLEDLSKLPRRYNSDWEKIPSF